MAELSDIIKKVSVLEKEISEALRVEVAEVVRDAIIKCARENVYDAYSPKFVSRRNGSGGILDPNSITIKVEGTELTATDDATWQHLWGGKYPNGRLAEAIASGDRRFNMQNAGPRPFHEKAKADLITSGAIEDALRRGLARQGIDATDVTFIIT